MKRVLLSFIIAFVLIVLYLTIAAIFVVATDYKLIGSSLIDYPLRLPKLVFIIFRHQIKKILPKFFQIAN